MSHELEFTFRDVPAILLLCVSWLVFSFAVDAALKVVPMMRSFLRRGLFGLLCGFLVASSALAQEYAANVQLTIDSTAAGISFTATDIRANAGHPQVNSASCTSNTSGGDFRYRIDGTAPTTTVGVLVPAGGALIFDTTNALLNFKGIRTAGTSAVLSCTLSSLTPLPSVYPVGAGGGSGGGASGDVNLTEVGGVAIALGTTTAANSIPVTFASDGSIVAAVVGSLSNNAGAPGSNNVGVLPAIANAAAPSYTEGRQVLLSTDLTGAVRVTGAAAGTQYVGDAAATATPTGTMAMGLANAAAPSDVSANNDAVAAWFLRSGAGVTQPSFGGVLAVAGNGASGTGVQRVTVANDSTGILAGVTTVTTLSTLTGGGVAAGAVDSGNPIKVGGIYSSALPTLDNGDRGNLQLTAGGALITAPSLTGAFATDVTFGTTTYTEASSTGPLNGAVRNDTIDALANTTNEAIPLTTNEVGALWVAKRDPCSWKAKSYYVVNLAATGTVEVANAVAGEFWYICSVNLVAQGANAFLIAHDDTDACGSITAGMNGGTTAATGWGFAANGGISLGNGDSAVLKSATANHYLCIAPSTTAQISGTIVYVSAP